MFIARGIGAGAGAAFGAVGTATGAVLTGATGGQVQWTKDMTNWYAEGTEQCAKQSGKNFRQGGAGAYNSIKNGALDPLAEQMYGVNDSTKHAQGRSHEQLQALLCRQDDDDGRLWNCQHLDEHLTDNGAAVQRYKEVNKHTIRNFLKSGSSSLHWNKLVYLTGHSTKGEGFCMHDDESYLTMEDILKWLEEGGYSGVLTLIVDSCYSGQFVKDMIRACNDQPEHMRKMQQYLDRNDYHLRVRIRASALASETSKRHEGGSKYTQSLVGRMLSEYARASGSGNNWGLQYARNHNASGSDTVFGATTSYAQTDLPVDFQYKGSGSWSWFYPDDRGHLI